MIPELDHLTAPEVELAYRAPILVSLLIAGADGKIDRKEIQGAVRSVQQKHKHTDSSLAVFLKEIGSDFEDKLKMLIQNFPLDPVERNQLISSELAKLNDLLPKLNQAFAQEYYHTLIEIAEKTARSSGGIFGIRKVGQEEAKYIRLPMIKASFTG